MSSMTSPATTPAAPTLGELPLASLKVLALLCKPLPINQVCDVSTWPRRKVEELARAQGLRIGYGGRARHPDGPHALAAIEAAATRAIYTLTRPHARHADTADGAAEPLEQPRNRDGDGDAAVTSPAGTGAGGEHDGIARDRAEWLRTAPIDALLSAAAEYDAARITAAAAKVDAAVTVLRDRLIAAERDRVQAEAAAKVGQLRAELAAAERQARQLGAKLPRRTTRAVGKPARRARPRGTDRRFWPGSDYTPRAVREWARANQMGDQVPPAGAFLPDHVVEAALAAGHGKADQLAEAGR